MTVASTAASFRVPVPAEVLLAAGSAEELLAALARGELEETEDGLLVANRVLVEAGEAGPALEAFETWLDGLASPSPQQLWESARLSDDPVPRFRQAVAAARLRGEEQSLAERVVDSEALPRLREEALPELLALLLRSSFHRQALPLIPEADAESRALARLAAGRPREALETGSPTTRARAWLALGEPGRALAELDGAPEAVMLRLRAASQLGEEPDLGPLEALVSRDPAWAVHLHSQRCAASLRHGRVRQARAELAALERAARTTDSRRGLGAARYYEAVIGLYAAQHGQLSAALRERPAFLPTGSEDYWSLLEVSERGLRSDWEAAESLASELHERGVFGAENQLAGLALRRGRPQRSGLRTATSYRSQDEERQLLLRLAARLLGEPDPYPEQAPRSRFVLAGVLLHRGRRALDRGDLAGALELADEGLALVATEGLEAHASDLLLLQADALARSERVAEAALSARAALVRAPHPDSPMACLASAALCRLEGGEPDDGRWRSLGAWEALALFAAEPPSEVHPHAWRLARQAFPERLAPGLEVDAMGFALKGERVDLSRRVALRLILQALTRRRLEHPGRALSVEEVVEAGWPGERILPDAAAGRVYVAVGSLRRMGLRGVLLSADGGYLLDAALPLRRR